jgi:xanthine/CO dehydrogenase XdhC/CoxF family maturation factor
MQEHARMMAAWQSAPGVCVLVTVVGTRGSSYRSPGARMLILPDGSRLGAVSGGCLEGELCRRAHWWTSQSPTVLKTFDTSTQEDNDGFGLGCGGGIELLVERLESPVRSQCKQSEVPQPERSEGWDTTTARTRIPVNLNEAKGEESKVLQFESHPLLAQQRVNESRQASALAVAVSVTDRCTLRVGDRFTPETAQPHPEVSALLDRCQHLGYSFTQELREGPHAGCRIFVESLAPPVQLLVCGAGTDAQPVVAQAAALGWSVLVMDQRADFARPSRFPEAERVIVAKDAAALERLQPDELRLDARTAAIVMSHSFAQDTFFLESLLARPLGYVGVLGSRRRTLDLLARLGRDAMPPELHAPAGLDIGAETPEQIALSILSEVQANFTGRPGSSLRQRDGSIHGREQRTARQDHQEQHSAPAQDCGLL